MANPVAALKPMRRLVRERLPALVLEPKVQDTFIGPGDDRPRVMHDFSNLYCLPVSRTETTSAATGTLNRRSIMDSYAREAGFIEFDGEPIPHDY